jgi:uncharacterized membrane protein
MWAHIGALLTWAASLIFGPLAYFCFISPLAVRSKWKNDPFVRHHTTQSLNSALTGLTLLAVGEILKSALGMSWVGFVLIVLAIARAIYEIIGSVKAHRGDKFPFPTWVAFHFIKDEDPALNRRVQVAAGAAGALALILTVLTFATGGTSAGGIRPTYSQAANALQYCELDVTWTTGASMKIAEGLDTTLVPSCSDLAAELTQNSQGEFTAASEGALASIPAGICTFDGVTLLEAPTVTSVACDGLEQDVNYLTPDAPFNASGS